jgi:hypothetical protein
MSVAYAYEREVMPRFALVRAGLPQWNRNPGAAIDGT